MQEDRKFNHRHAISMPIEAIKTETNTACLNPIKPEATGFLFILCSFTSFLTSKQLLMENENARYNEDVVINNRKTL